MLDSRLRTAPLRTIDGAACARSSDGYKPADGERFDARMRCSIDADGKPPLFGNPCGAGHLPSVFADVARYRSFIRDRSPTWAPTKAGATVRVTGTRRVGRTRRAR